MTIIWAYVPGVSQHYISAMLRWRQLWQQAAAAPAPQLPDPKEFKPKFPQIPKRDNYEGCFDSQWWEKFPINLECPGKSLVKETELRKLAHTYSCSNVPRLERVCDRLRNRLILAAKANSGNRHAAPMRAARTNTDHKCPTP